MKNKIILIYADALYMNYHRNAFLNSLLQHSVNWKKFNINNTFVDVSLRETIINEAKSADALVVDSSVFSIGYKKVFDDATFYSASLSPPSDYYDFIQTLMNIETPRVWLSNLDLHANFKVLGVNVNDFQAVSSYYFPNRFTPKSDIDFNIHEPWMDLYRPPEAGYDELMKIPVHIELPFCLDSSEFSNENNVKLWNLMIPGANYARRKFVRQHSSFTSKYLRFEYITKSIRFFASMNYKLTKYKLPIKWSINFGRIFHHKIIALSKATYTDGSAYNYPVRKFFEIPAQKSLLLCADYPGIEDRGYIDGKTHISVDYTEVHKLIRKIDFNSKSINEIIQNGFNTTLKLHNSVIRANQLIKAIELFSSGQLKSAYFKNGEYCYLRG